MARFCICGCRKELLTTEGETDYDRMFFSKACRDRDKAQRLKDKRKKLSAKTNCPTCGQPMPKKAAAVTGV